MITEQINDDDDDVHQLEFKPLNILITPDPTACLEIVTRPNRQVNPNLIQPLRLTTKMSDSVGLRSRDSVVNFLVNDIQQLHKPAALLCQQGAYSTAVSLTLEHLGNTAVGSRGGWAVLRCAVSYSPVGRRNGLPLTGVCRKYKNRLQRSEQH